MAITKSLFEQSIKTPEAKAIMFHDESWTYKELYEKSLKIAHYLVKKGYKKDDIVAQFTLNSNLFMAIYYGVQLAGLTVMPVNTKLASPEVEYIFKHSKAKVLIYDEKLQGTIDFPLTGFDEVLTLEKIQAIIDTQMETQELPTMDLEETSVVMYTSGTTGKPKGVMLSHRNVFETAEIWSESMEMYDEYGGFACTASFHGA